MIGDGCRNVRRPKAAVARTDDRERAEHPGRGPAPVAPLDQPEHQSADGQHEDQGSGQVRQRRALVVPHVGDVADRAEHEQQPDREVDPERPLPRQLDQAAAERGAERGRHRAGHRPETRGRGALLRRHRGQQQAEAGRRHRSGTDCLEHAESHQPPDPRSEPAGQAGRDEQGHAGDEPALLPCPIGEPAHRDQQRGVHDGVRVEDPAQLGELGAREVLADLVEGDVDDEEVDAGQERRTDQHRGDDPLTLVGIARTRRWLTMG